MNGARWLLLALALGVFASSLGLVYTRHQSRALFVELQDLQAARDRLEVEWGQLQLEQSTWGTHGRVERLARERLGMEAPSPERVVIVRP
ncbi:MAG: cell division protein FtsL [Gammaproteobacteria bacterium]|nr:cell division protein FtsL [Gammaproteobacteria bacterium]